MTLEIISPHKVLFKGDADMVTLPGRLGSFTVLRNHAPLISVLDKGKVAYRTPAGAEESIDISGGLADIDNNVISVCIF